MPPVGGPATGWLRGSPACPACWTQSQAFLCQPSRASEATLSSAGFYFDGLSLSLFLEVVDGRADASESAPRGR